MQNLKLAGETREIFFDPKNWSDDQSVFPKYESINSWNGWVTAAAVASGLGNHEVAGDPKAWTEANAVPLQSFYTEISKILLDPNKKPLSIRALNRPDMETRVTPEDYADWFGATRPQIVETWPDAAAFFTANPQFTQEINNYLDRFEGAGGIAAKFKHMFTIAKGFRKDSAGRYFYEADGKPYQLMRSQGRNGMLMYYSPVKQKLPNVGE
jgi:hypothetical protein